MRASVITLYWRLTLFVPAAIPHRQLEHALEKQASSDFGVSACCDAMSSSRDAMITSRDAIRILCAAMSTLCNAATFAILLCSASVYTEHLRPVDPYGQEKAETEDKRPSTSL